MKLRKISLSALPDKLAAANLAIVLLVLLLERFPGERWWPTLLLVYSPQAVWVIPSVVVMGFALVRRRWIAAGASLLPILIVVTMLMGVQSGGKKSTGTPDLRVLTWNLQYGRGGDSLPRLVLSVWPDIICLQEANPWAEKDLPRMLELPQFKDWHYKVCGELVILSRFPLKRLGTTHSALWVSADVDGTEVLIADVHMAIPYRPGLNMVRPGRLHAASELRMKQAEEIISHTTNDRTVIVCGDFNTPPNTRVYRTLRSHFENAFEQAGRGFGLTYLKSLPLVRIDHIFVSRDARAVRCWMPEIDASNHCPVCADIRLPREEDSGPSRVSLPGS